LLLLVKKKPEKELAQLYISIAEKYKAFNPDSALFYLRNAENLSRKYKDTSQIAHIYNQYGNIDNLKGNYPNAILKYRESIVFAKAISDSVRLGNLLNNIGIIYRRMGNYDSSLYYYLVSLSIKEKTKNQKDIISTMNNIGSLYYTQKLYAKAEEYYKTAVKMAKEYGDTTIIAATYNNLGLILFEQKRYDEALKSYDNAMAIWQKTDNWQGVASAKNNKGRVYEINGNLEQALANYYESADIYKELGDVLYQANSISNAANIYATKGQYDKAMSYFKIAEHIADSLNNFPQLKDTYLQMASCYKNWNKPNLAYDYLLKYTAISDSLYTEQMINTTSEMEAKYQTDKQSTEIELLKKQQLIQELANENQGAKLKKQRIVIISTILVLIAAIIIVVLLYTRFRSKRIAALRLQVQKDQLEQKNTEILDSIKYAKRIQEAILPNNFKIQQYLANSFVLFKPKDIVSGDFYWVEMMGIDKVKKAENIKIKKDYIHSPIIMFATVDCTGHGVPGAFMSLLGYNALNQAVNTDWINEPGVILNYIDKSLTETFEQNNQVETIKDGMDMSLCSIDYTNNLLQFAGANNPLWIVSKRRNANRYILKNNVRTILEPKLFVNDTYLYEIKGNPVAIGTAIKRKQIYDNYTIELKEGESVYIFTDGFADQFGGTENKKYMYRRLREKIISIYNEPINNQKQLLEQEFEEWRGKNEQVDDICLIGVRI
jgi:tetratricopeptide (TPR) repeat protein